MYTKYQIAKAQSISLLDYIESRGYELVYSHNEVRLKKHDSLVISNNKWKWFSRNVGGGTLDFLIEYEVRVLKKLCKLYLAKKVLKKANHNIKNIFKNNIKTKK